MQISVRRPLSCGEYENSYLIELDSALELKASWPLQDTGVVSETTYSQTLSSDGTCADFTPVSDSPAASFSVPSNANYPSAQCTNALPDYTEITLFYNPDTLLINLNARVSDGSYAGFGWGSSMVNTEMVIFSADGTSSSVGNYYSTTEDTPQPYPTVDSCYTTSISPGTGFVVFNVTRPLDCGIANTYVVQLDTNFTVINAWNPTNPELSYHGPNETSYWTILDSTGSCQGDPTPVPIPDELGSCL